MVFIFRTSSARLYDTEKYCEKLCATVYTTSVDLSFLIGPHNSYRSCSLAQPPLSRRLRREIKLFPNRPSYPPTCVTHAGRNLARLQQRAEIRRNSQFTPSSVPRRRDAPLILQSSRRRAREGERGGLGTFLSESRFRGEKEINVFTI